MSFSFSQSLLDEIPSSQASLSDSSQPPTQPMLGCTGNQPSIQNMTLPMPWLPPPRNAVTSSNSSFGQQRAKYSRVEATNNNHSKAVMGDILRDVQAKINSVSLSSSRMLEEALVFLEKEVTKENSKTLTDIRSVDEILSELTDLVQVMKEENEKNSKHCLETAKLLRMVLRAVKEDEDETVKVTDSLNGFLEVQMRKTQYLLDKLNKTIHDASSNLGEISKEKVTEKLMLHGMAKELSHVKELRRTRGEICLRRREANPPPTTARTAVRSFSFTREVRSQVQPILDFSTIMEVDDLDSDTDTEWEE